MGDPKPAASNGKERPLRFAIIGAGMAGILSAIKLREAGYHDFTVFEKGDRVGGTWRENTYPGLSCDVPSHLYSYSFEPNPEWSHRFSPGPEIHAYFEGVARRHGVLPQVRFGDEVTRCDYRAGRWQIETKSGHHETVDVVIAATGVLHHPRYPEIAGLGDFEGALFHSARWDHQVQHRRPARGCDRDGLDRRADHVRGRPARGEALALPAHRAVDHAAGESRLQRGRAGRVPPAPGDGRSDARGDGPALRGLLRAGWSTRARRR